MGLREWRKRVGRSMEDVARCLGISVSQLSRMENGGVLSVTREIVLRALKMSKGEVDAHVLLDIDPKRAASGKSGVTNGQEAINRKVKVKEGRRRTVRRADGGDVTGQPNGG